MTWLLRTDKATIITEQASIILTRLTLVAFKQMILNFMVRYFYLICFSVYASENGPDGFIKTFSEVSLLDTREHPLYLPSSTFSSGWRLTAS